MTMSHALSYGSLCLPTIYAVVLVPHRTELTYLLNHFNQSNCRSRYPYWRGMWWTSFSFRHTTPSRLYLLMLRQQIKSRGGIIY
jgi:hypothetical protein